MFFYSIFVLYFHVQWTVQFFYIPKCGNFPTFFLLLCNFHLCFFEFPFFLIFWPTINYFVDVLIFVFVSFSNWENVLFFMFRDMVTSKVQTKISFFKMRSFLSVQFSFSLPVRYLNWKVNLQCIVTFIQPHYAMITAIL